MSALPSNEPVTDFARRLQEAGIGLVRAERFDPVTVSQTPYRLERGQWTMAMATARALGALFDAVRRQTSWLRDQFSAVTCEDLASELCQRLPTGRVMSTALSLTRHDLILDTQQNWRLIESNSIAAGMGPFSDQLSHIMAADHPHLNFAPNGATERQAQSLLDAALKTREATSPLVVFVVEPNEDNRLDQGMLADEITRLGGQVVYRTLAQLQVALDRSSAPELWLEDGRLVDLLYFRTGYNLQDYGADPSTRRLRLDLRAALEQRSVALCPSMAGQLSTHKMVQRRLSALSVSELMTTFELPVQAAVLAHLALAVKYRDVNPDTLESDLSSGRWLLKGTGEGGGQVYGEANRIPSSIDNQRYLLMQRLQLYPRAHPAIFVRGTGSWIVDKPVSELGIFTVGSDARYGGYLLRSKASTALESGVHRGDGAIDTVVLV
ncbi:glutathione synthetase [Reinekea blandensis]|uniref:glutathione synthase n=1 Tax=Reinekea blandensis MED297 TaxID=314283 RepID=A4BJZ6_9GAMM|nr:glutathione synthetase [Reinekea blandensis]EAR07529.1 glutathione synthetase [Reinekea sp. MED297] [Reinekea blandensis MED297]